MGIEASFAISASGMDMERQRLEVSAMNLANAGTTRTADGSPFHRKVLLARVVPVASTGLADPSAPTACAVASGGVVDDPAPSRREYNPSHPDAGSDGWVTLPNVEPVEEMVHVMMAARGFEANAAAFSAARDMAMRALEMARAT